MENTSPTSVNYTTLWHNEGQAGSRARSFSKENRKDKR